MRTIWHDMHNLCNTDLEYQPDLMWTRVLGQNLRSITREVSGLHCTLSVNTVMPTAATTKGQYQGKQVIFAHRRPPLEVSLHQSSPATCAFMIADSFMFALLDVIHGGTDTPLELSRYGSEHQISLRTLVMFSLTSK